MDHPPQRESAAEGQAQAEIRSRRMASECAELRDRLAKKQEDSSRLEGELLPAAERGVAEERQRTLRLHEELNSARMCMDKAEVEAQALRKEWLEAEAQAHSNSLQEEL